jgi:phosphoadenosine phosphosulfate reductase
MNTSPLTPPISPLALSWSPANLSHLNRRYEQLHPRDVLRWGLSTYGADFALATGFSPSGIILMHLISQMKPRTVVFYLQTDMLFPETMQLRDELAERLDIQFTEVHCNVSLEDQKGRYGPNLWESAPDLCCHVRKVVPMRHFLSTKKAWATAIRRDQSITRAFTQVISWDKNNLVVKLCPLATWTSEQVWEYIREHNLPTNVLHAQGYPSIGCIPCTQSVDSGEDERAGRWAGLKKTECGIHVQPVEQVEQVEKFA